MKTRTGAAALGLALALGGCVAGAAAAQTPDPTPDPTPAAGDVRAWRRACWDYDLAGPVAIREQACTALLGTNRLGDYDLAVTYRFRGDARATLGDDPAAIRDFTAAMVAQPRDPQSWMMRGATWHRLGDEDEAAADWIRALELRPDLPAAQANLGMLAHSAGDLEAMTVRLRAAAASRRADAGTLNVVCWEFATAGIHLDEAAAACALGLRKAPRDPLILDSAAFVALRQGDLAAAEAGYAQALALAPGQAVSIYGRGLTRLRLGRAAEGQADLDRATALDAGVTAQFTGWGLTP